MIGFRIFKCARAPHGTLRSQSLSTTHRNFLGYRYRTSTRYPTLAIARMRTRRGGCGVMRAPQGQGPPRGGPWGGHRGASRVRLPPVPVSHDTRRTRDTRDTTAPPRHAEPYNPSLPRIFITSVHRLDSSTCEIIPAGAASSPSRGRDGGGARCCATLQYHRIAGPAPQTGPDHHHAADGRGCSDSYWSCMRHTDAE